MLRPKATVAVLTSVFLHNILDVWSFSPLSHNIPLYERRHDIAASTAAADLDVLDSDLVDDILAVAVSAAKKAGRIILENSQGADVAQLKANSRDLLTQIDPMCEQVCASSVSDEYSHA